MTGKVTDKVLDQWPQAQEENASNGESSGLAEANL
jgi:hypothetical protein